MNGVGLKAKKFSCRNGRFGRSFVDSRFRLVKRLLLLFHKLNTCRDLRTLAASLYRRDTKIVDSSSSSDCNVVTLFIDLTGYGAQKPVTYHFYVSVQRSPLRPYQFVTRYHRLKKEMRRWSADSDRYYVFIGPRPTSTIKEEMRRLRIFYARNVDEVLDFIAGYFKRRLSSLINSVRGKRIWGPLALLVLLFNRIVKQLTGRGHEEVDEYTELRLTGAVEKPQIIFT